MPFNNFLFSIIATCVLVLQRIVLLILYPYKTMRKIGLERDYGQIMVIALFIYGYLLAVNRVREYSYEPGILFLLTIFHYIASVLFFQFITSIFCQNKTVDIKPFLFTLAYAIIPTLIWLGVNSILYYILPPPRTFSMLGKAFSILYISFSIAMLVWKVILQYLAIRFASRMPFYKIMYSLLLYIVIVGPYFFWMYVMKFFRMPII